MKIVLCGKERREKKRRAENARVVERVHSQRKEKKKKLLYYTTADCFLSPSEIVLIQFFSLSFRLCSFVLLRAPHNPALASLNRMQICAQQTSSFIICLIEAAARGNLMLLYDFEQTRQVLMHFFLLLRLLPLLFLFRLRFAFLFLI